MSCKQPEEPSIKEWDELIMVSDKKTAMYVKFAKIMVIYQGFSTEKRRKTVEKIKENTFKYASCVLTDRTFSSKTKLLCVPDNTEEFFNFFRSESKKALEEGNNLLVLDATLSNMKQNLFYVALAQQMQYVVLVVPPVISFSKEEDWPSGSLAGSYKSVKVYIRPPTMFRYIFSGWFLHDVDSYELRREVSYYLQDCIDYIPDFKKFFHQKCSLSKLSSKHKHPDVESFKTDPETIELIRDHFNLVDQWQDPAYCVLKVFSDDYDMTYFDISKVRENYGKMSKLQIVGFLVSPHLIAARVRLTFNQKDLWDQPDECDENSRIPVQPGPHHRMQLAKQELPTLDCKQISSKSNRTLVPSGIDIREPLKSIHPNAKGRSCHIVVATAKDADPRNIDYDVKFALNRMRRASADDVVTEELERCVVQRIGRYWYIFLRSVLSVDGFMSAYCKPFQFDDPVDMDKCKLKR